jgi:hypothetical protein
VAYGKENQEFQGNISAVNCCVFAWMMNVFGQHCGVQNKQFKSSSWRCVGCPQGIIRWQSCKPGFWKQFELWRAGVKHPK